VGELMARIRTIKPGFFRSDDVTPLSYRARLTWVGLWTYVDDDGRGKDNARIIKGEIWTLEDDITHVEVEEDLDELHRHDRISRYEVDGKRYLVINKWDEHQVISRPTPSKLPEPTGENMLPHAALTDDSVSAPPLDTAGRGKGSGRGREEERELEGPQSWAIEPPVDSTWFQYVWQNWPKKDDRKDAALKWPKAVRESGMSEAELAGIALNHAAAYRAHRTRQMTPAFVVWLNKARWDNEPIGPDNGRPTKEDQLFDVIEQGRRMQEQADRLEIQP
jgi:hypothetical protein